jgi:D-alanine transaminase
MVDTNGVLRVRHLDEAILPGCTRAALLSVLTEAGITAETRAFSVEELRHAREVFITSASSFVKPVTTLDDAPVADGQVGPVTRRLFDLFARHVMGGLPNAA